MNFDQSPPTASATLTVRPSVPEDVTYLAPRLRKEDLDSVIASGSASAEMSLARGLRYSDLCLTATDQSGNPVLMFGTVPSFDDPTFGHLWFLASDRLDTHQPSLLREARRYIATFQQKYHVLLSFIDRRAPLRERWIRVCGFKFGRTIQGPGLEGQPFREAYKIRRDECAIH